MVKTVFQVGGRKRENLDIWLSDASQPFNMYSYHSSIVKVNYAILSSYLFHLGSLSLFWGNMRHSASFYVKPCQVYSSKIKKQKKKSVSTMRYFKSKLLDNLSWTSILYVAFYSLICIVKFSLLYVCARLVNVEFWTHANLYCLQNMLRFVLFFFF